MVTQNNRYPTIASVTIAEEFDEIAAELYVPYTANGKNERLKIRDFIFVDGEGVKREPENPDSESVPVLMGASTGERLKGYDLSTVQSFNFLITLKKEHPKAIFVGFGLGWDINQWCKDIPPNLLIKRIRKAKPVRWKHYTILYMTGKKFQITDRIQNITVVVSDVFTFFGTSFVAKNPDDRTNPGACEQFLGWDDARLVQIREGKERRDNFTYDEVDEFIEPYMSLELDIGVDLMNRLRHYMFNAGIRPRGWHGPGAVASALLTREGVRKHMQVPDERTTKWSRLAYFGGRFEQMRTGYYTDKVFQYDIRSAYPAALTHCPGLGTGTWTFRKQPTDNGSLFKMYMVRYRDQGVQFTDWNPLPLRSRHQTIHYQNWVHGVYWAPEIEVVRKFKPSSLEILGVLEYEDTGVRPFAFVADMYDQRSEWKTAGNPAQLALKLALNSLYGKLAQRVGYDEKLMLPPPSHCLEWAGFVTSYCRGKMLELMYQDPDAIIAVETDGIFSTKPLMCDIGPGLGQMEADTWDEICYIQSGVYFKRSGDEWKTGKTRGFGKNTLKVEDALYAAQELQTLEIEQNRFIGMAYADSPNWRHFLPHPHAVQWGGNGKRRHDPDHCDGCRDDTMWHQTRFVHGGIKSEPHILPWIDGRKSDWQESVDYKETFL